MARRVFFSFYYAGDGWRASQVRNMGALEGNAPCSDNDWEAVKKGGNNAIEKWIADQLVGKVVHRRFSRRRNREPEMGHTRNQ